LKLVIDHFFIEKNLPKKGFFFKTLGNEIIEVLGFKTNDALKRKSNDQLNKQRKKNLLRLQTLYRISASDFLDLI
tara:strand:- start:502 stop:726 length:225 start_codon:yes stop_codon:yes gene_type:complete